MLPSVPLANLARGTVALINCEPLIVLFVSVAVEAADTNLESPPVLGSVKTLSALSECGAAFIFCP